MKKNNNNTIKISQSLETLFPTQPHQKKKRKHPKDRKTIFTD